MVKFHPQRTVGGSAIVNVCILQRHKWTVKSTVTFGSRLTGGEENVAAISGGGTVEDPFAVTNDKAIDALFDTAAPVQQKKVDVADVVIDTKSYKMGHPLYYDTTLRQLKTTIGEQVGVDGRTIHLACSSKKYRTKTIFGQSDDNGPSSCEYVVEGADGEAVYLDIGDYGKEKDEIGGMFIDKEYGRNADRSIVLRSDSLVGTVFGEFNGLVLDAFLLDGMIPDRVALTRELTIQTQFEQIYNGFVAKYFPWLSPGDWLKVAQGKDVKQEETPPFAGQGLYEALLVGGKRAAEWDIRANIVNATININFTVADRPILDLRNLFDFVACEAKRGGIVHMKLRRPSDKTLWAKMNRKYAEDNPDKIEKWNGNDPKGLVVKYVIGSSISPDDKAVQLRIASANVFEDGKIGVLVSWQKAQDAWYPAIGSAANELRGLISAINESHTLSFLGDDRVPNITKSMNNVSVPSISVRAQIHNVKVNLGALRAVCEVFTPFLYVVGLENDTLSLRYMRVSFEKKTVLSLLSKEYKETVNEGKDVQIRNFVGEDGESYVNLTTSGIKSAFEVELVLSRVVSLIALTLADRSLFSKEMADRATVAKIVPLLRDNAANVRAKQRSKSTKNVKILQEIDMRLFNYDRWRTMKRIERVSGREEAEKYSRSCQNNQQPWLLSKEALAKVPRGKYTFALPYTNKTDPDGEISYYVCLKNKLHRYPGFLPSTKHPDGYCLPCCHKIDTVINGRPTNVARTRQCIQDDMDSATPAVKDKLKGALHDTIESHVMKNSSEVDMPTIDAAESGSTDDSDSPNGDLIAQNVTKYVRQYGKAVEHFRLGVLPPLLAEVINDDQCRLTKMTNVIASGSVCSFMLGIRQWPSSLIFALGLCGHSVDDPMSVLDVCISRLNEIPGAFPLLSQGKVKQRFGTIERYVAYLRSKEEVTAEYFVDMFHLGTVGKYAVLIFEEHETVEETTGKNAQYLLNCGQMPGRLAKDMQEKPAILLLHRVTKGIWYPIVRIKSNESPGAAPSGGAKEGSKGTAAGTIVSMAIDKKIHPELHERLGSLTKAYEVIGETSHDTINYEKYGIRKEFNSVAFSIALHEKGAGDASLLTDDDGLVSFVLFSKGGTAVQGVPLPVNLAIPQRIRGMAGVRPVSEADIPSAAKMIAAFNWLTKEYRWLRPTMALVDRNGRFVGFRANNGLDYMCAPAALPKEAQRLQIRTISHTFLGPKRDKTEPNDYRLKHANRVIYDLEIYNLFLLHVADRLHKDKGSRSAVERAIAAGRKAVLQPIIDRVARKAVVIVGSAKVQVEALNVRNVCSDLRRGNEDDGHGFCARKGKGSGSMALVITGKAKYDALLSRATEDILDNKLLQFRVLHNRLARILDRNVFIIRDTEIIVSVK